MAEDTVRILFLAGSARCGSTLVGRMLGELPGLVNTGELGVSLLSADAQAVNAPCGCGAEEADCLFWASVSQGRPLRDYGLPWRTRRLLRLWWRLRRDPQLRGRLAAALLPLYRRVAAEAGARWVVDISKEPVIGMILAQLPGVEMAVLHLVREPCGVVASWRRRKGYLPKIRPIKVIGWIWRANLMAEWLSLGVSRHWRLRYRDFVGDPGPALGAIAAGLNGARAPGGTEKHEFLRPGEVLLGMQHGLVSNPDKLDAGWVPLRLPVIRLDRPSRWLTHLLTWPLLWRYGYWRRMANQRA